MTNKIQIITYPPIIVSNFSNLTVSRFNGFYALDSFDYNLIRLNSDKLLDYSSSNDRFNNENDFQSLKTNLNDSDDCMIIVALPQNLKNSYGRELKNSLNIIYTHIRKFYSLPDFQLIFGKNNTEIEDKNFSADFYLSEFSDDCEIITKNKNGNVTTIQHDNIVYKTLDFKNEDEINCFIKVIEEFNDDVEEPNWFKDVEMFDDVEKKQLIELNTNKINELKSKNEVAKNKLTENNKYKSILYKKSKPLEDGVRLILQDLLNYNLSDFEDIGEEDFLIEFDNVTFIGEIKGVKKNITNNHLSELDIHFTRRQDKIENENLQPILVANRFLERPPQEREPVNHKQIEWAKNKYKCLIIDSYELLKLYEKFKNGDIKTEEIIRRFDEEIGLFEA